MTTAILHANLKEIGRCLLVVKIKHRKLIVLAIRMWNLSNNAYTIGCSSQAINHA